MLFLDGTTIIDSSNWSEVLSMILSGLNYLDSIILFDFGAYYTTFLDFDIALMVFGLVWNTVGLWHYDFDEVYYDPYHDYSELDAVVSDLEAHNFYADEKDDEPPEPEPDIDILVGDDDDFM